jgi:hypothetical protein
LLDSEIPIIELNCIAHRTSDFQMNLVIPDAIPMWMGPYMLTCTISRGNFEYGFRNMDFISRFGIAKLWFRTFEGSLKLTISALFVHFYDSIYMFFLFSFFSQFPGPFLKGSAPPPLRPASREYSFFFLSFFLLFPIS